MPRDPKPVVVYLRMSPQLREGLRAAAVDAGCSLNAFAVQVLAAAAGDPARFRVASEPEAELEEDVERDRQGFPLRGRLRRLHMDARGRYIEALERAGDWPAGHIRKLDTEDPGFYVRWAREREAGHEGPGSAGRRGAA